MNHSLQERREAAGISQRELSRRTGIAQARLSRVEGGEVEPNAGEGRLIEAALGEALGAEGVTAAPEPAPAAPDRRYAPRAGRRAYVCMTCEPPQRRFVGAGEGEPSCRHHGRMLEQENGCYRGQAVPA